jgi:hypothetical protein
MGYDRRALRSWIGQLSALPPPGGWLTGNNLNDRPLSLVSPTRHISIICRSRLRRDEATSRTTA